MTESIRIRVRKMLALASDPGATDNERAVAMEKAQRLIEEHNIEIGELSTDPDHIEVIKGDRVGKGFHKTFHRILAAAVQELYGAKNVFYDKGRDGHEFWGMRHQVEASEETFIWIVAQVEQLYRVALNGYDGKLDRAGRMELRSSFKDACAIRVAQRIQQIIADRADKRAQGALVVVNVAKQKTDGMFEAVGGKVSKTPAIRSGFGTQAGLIAGDHVRIQKEVQR